jgi:hypothetical protein
MVMLDLRDIGVFLNVSESGEVVRDLALKAGCWTFAGAPFLERSDFFESEGVPFNGG